MKGICPKCGIWIDSCNRCGCTTATHNRFAVVAAVVLLATLFGLQVQP